MFRTLGGLAVAMTGTAGVLAWMDPSIPLGADSLTYEELSRIAYRLVQDDVRVDARRWREVELVAARLDARGTMLAAAADDGECHFYIDEAGQAVQGRRWRQQTGASHAPHTVRIEIGLGETMPNGGEGMSLQQWQSVQALLQALDTTVGDPGQPLPLRMEPGIAAPAADQSFTSRDARGNLHRAG